MKIVVAPQAFKGTASAVEVANTICEAVQQRYPDSQVSNLPIADGGGGTVAALVSATGGSYVMSPTLDPLGRRIDAWWGVLGDDQTAVIETAAASGLSLLNESELDPLAATSVGTGLLMRAALEAGYQRILLGLGDSGTNDAGVGMARAMGVKALDKQGHILPPGGGSLSELDRFDVSDIYPGLFTSEIIALCDVNTLLYGEKGASAIFGPQKGATAEQVGFLDKALRRFSNVIESQLGLKVGGVLGGGAAGGLGAGLKAFCGAELQGGFAIISETLGLPSLLDGADFVLTGEGSLDSQTHSGKGVSGVSRLSKEKGVPFVVAIVGSNKLSAEDYESLGIDQVVSLSEFVFETDSLNSDTLKKVDLATKKALELFHGINK